jgi:hypothetical protein
MIPTRIIWIIGLSLFFLGIGLLTYVYANDTETVIEETFKTYLKAIQTAMDNKIVLAPVDSK